MENTIFVNDFFEKYDNASTEEQQYETIRGMMINEYVPYLIKKVTLLPAINEAVVKNDGMLPYLDETLLEVNYFICLLLLYTRLNIEEYLKESSPFNLYDEFCKRKIKGTVFGLIDANEINEMDKLSDGLKKNWIDINTGIESLLYSFYQKLIKVDYEELIKNMEQIHDTSNENIED